MKTVVGMFNTTKEAQRTLDDLTQMGFGPSDISVVTAWSAKESLESRLGLRELDVSDLGRVAVSGPIAESLEKTTTSGLVTTLQYYGLSPKLAEHYTLGVLHGETLETLTVEDKDADRVVAIMERHARMEREAEAKENAGKTAGIAASNPNARATEKFIDKPATRGNGEALANRPEHIFGGDTELRIPIVREELRVGKREVERGGVNVHVHVSETPATGTVHLREEHVEIERHLVDRAPLPGEVAFRGQDISFEEYAEEPVVSKEARVVEEVVIHKRVTAHDETISDRIRAMEVNVDPLLGFDRADYERHLSSLDARGKFEEFRPAYELGHKLHRSTGRSWEEIESEAKEAWESKNPGTWPRFRDAVRYAWSKKPKPS